MAYRIHTTRDFGGAIYDARKAAGMTQAELANRAGVSRSWLIGFEAGERSRAELERVLRVLRALKLEITLTPPPERTGNLALDTVLELGIFEADQ